VNAAPPRAAGRRATVAAVLAFVAMMAGAAAAQTATRLQLERSDADIELVNAGRADEGARSILRLPGCEPTPDDRATFFYAPGGGVTARIVQEEGEPAVVAAPLMIVRQPPAVEGADGPSDAETLEAIDATTGFGRPPCPEGLERAEAPEVELVQGRTRVVGRDFFLDRGADVATMAGPVRLVRTPASGGDVVRADAEALRYDLDGGRSTLTGGVRVEAGDRISEADTLALDEGAGVAILSGDPAVSRAGDDEVRGRRLRYDLETNDVVIEGNVEGTFELGE